MASMFPTHVGIARSQAWPDADVMHVPYACGDCAERLAQGKSILECSLRMWGLRVGQVGPVQLIFMFPTHVGIARTEARTCDASSDVPYACGDCASAFAKRQIVDACSLRMWGLRESQQSIAPEQEMFPTHVGIARRCVMEWKDKRNVPYACGDCADAVKGAFTIGGCSLRMWGLREEVKRQRCRRCMFPTHVGIARNLHSPRQDRGNVPYACGDCADHLMRTLSAR